MKPALRLIPKVEPSPMLQAAPKLDCPAVCLIAAWRAVEEARAAILAGESWFAPADLAPFVSRVAEAAQSLANELRAD